MKIPEILESVKELNVNTVLNGARGFSPVQWIFVLVLFVFGLWLLWSVAKVLFLPALVILGIWAGFRWYQGHK